MSNQTETSIIEATLFWPNLNKKNDMSGKFQVDLGELNKAAVKTLQGMGINVKTDDPKDADKPDRCQYVTAKSGFPFKVLFKNGVEVVSPDLIGNGTKARIKVGPYEWTFKGKKGVSPSVKVLQVTELVKYSAPVDPDFEDSTPWEDDDLDDDIDDVFSDD